MLNTKTNLILYFKNADKLDLKEYRELRLTISSERQFHAVSDHSWKK